jgi:CheY-like chemotaxis protein
VPDSLRGTLETILVVDDNDMVREVVVQILEHANFRVLSAECGPAALELAQQPGLKIDPLLSDVDMPQMTGPDLGEILKKTKPDLHVMLMSGGARGHLLVLNYGWAFIQKPFVPQKLSRGHPGGGLRSSRHCQNLVAVREGRFRQAGLLYRRNTSGETWKNSASFRM